MTEQNQHQQSRHWEELARQLGLRPDDEHQPAEIAKPASMPTAEIAGEHASQRPAVHEESSPPGRHPIAEQIEPPPAVEVTAEASSEQPDPDRPEPVDAEERPARGRRRRGRRGGRAEPEAPRPDHASAEGSATEATEETPGRPATDEETKPAREHRGRGRSRKAKDAEPAAADRPPATTTADQETAAEEADDEDVDTLSDWNVPSWQELIASLYRPER